MERHVRFEDWFKGYFGKSRNEKDEFSFEEMRLSFNAGRTEGRPRVWRYKKNGGSWQVEFLELPNETSSSSKQSVSNEERLSGTPEVSSSEATDSQI